LIVGRSGCWTEKTRDGYRTASRLMGIRKGELEVIEDIRFRKVEFPQKKVQLLPMTGNDPRWSCLSFHNDAPASRLV
jgi:hypothetical protein